MYKKYILIVLIILAFPLYYEIFFNADIIDIDNFIGGAFLLGFQIFASLWVYKDIIGRENFANTEGFSLKRKKED